MSNTYEQLKQIEQEKAGKYQTALSQKNDTEAAPGQAASNSAAASIFDLKYGPAFIVIATALVSLLFAADILLFYYIKHSVSGKDGAVARLEKVEKALNIHTKNAEAFAVNFKTNNFNIKNIIQRMESMDARLSMMGEEIDRQEAVIKELEKSKAALKSEIDGMKNGE